MNAADTPLLSVIIVAYRSRDELPACLGSIPRELAGRRVEVVVVDNSRNADGTGDLVRRDFGWVDYVPPESNLGFGRANNLGFKRTAGECVLFLNPDTIVNADALAHCVGRAMAEPMPHPRPGGAGLEDPAGTWTPLADACSPGRC